MQISEIIKTTTFNKFEEIIIYKLRIDFEVFDEEDSEIALLDEWLIEYTPDIIISDMEKFLVLQKKNCELFSDWLNSASPDREYLNLSERPYHDYIKEGAKVKGFSENNLYYGYINKIKDMCFTTDTWWIEKNPITSALISRLKLMKDKLSLRDFLKLMKCIHFYYD
jgi:hypothetical protein